MRAIAYVFISMIIPIFARANEQIDFSRIKQAYAESITYDSITGINIHIQSLNPQQLPEGAASTYKEAANQSACKRFYSCPGAYTLSVNDTKTFAVVVIDIGGSSMGLSVFDVDGKLLDSASKFQSGDLSWTF